MGQEEVQAHAKEKGTVDGRLGEVSPQGGCNGGSEIEWQDELSFTEAEMLDALLDVAVKGRSSVYTGKGAFTISEMVKRAKERGQSVCAGTMRKDVVALVEEGVLVEVVVRRRNSSNKPYSCNAYVKPEVFEAETKE